VPSYLPKITKYLLCTKNNTKIYVYVENIASTGERLMASGKTLVPRTASSCISLSDPRTFWHKTSFYAPKKVLHKNIFVCTKSLSMYKNFVSPTLVFG